MLCRHVYKRENERGGMIERCIHATMSVQRSDDTFRELIHAFHIYIHEVRSSSLSSKGGSMYFATSLVLNSF